MSAFSFNLIDRPWISCVELSGRRRTLGLHEVLSRAHELRGIELQSPLAETALFRVLLAAVHRIVEGPKGTGEWRALYQATKLPGGRIDAYFEKWSHRFDLFSKEEPFYQTPGLAIRDAKGAEAPAVIAGIMLERASGNNKTIFDHSMDEDRGCLSPEEAVLALIAAQMYSLRGLNKKTTNLFGYQESFSDSVMVGGIFAALQGQSLFESLLLNLLLYTDNLPIHSSRDDCPVWERHDHGETGVRTPRGYLDYLTCKCRHILLVPEPGLDGPCIRHVHIAQGEAFQDVDNPGFIKRKNKEGKWLPVQMQPARLVWRDSISLFSFDTGKREGDRRPDAFRLVGDIALRRIVALPSKYRCCTYGLANDQANPLAWRKETLNIPTALLSDPDLVACLREAMDLSEKAHTILRNAIRTYMDKYLPRNSRDVTEKLNATGASRLFWDRLESHFNAFLLEIENQDKALVAWERNIERAALEAFEACLKQRYADSAKKFRAWTEAHGQLVARLATLSKTLSRKGG
ncbi:type I-E CRISPR-associated protein Cse1/CasA [Syntrophobacter fumaroxidans]|uniref:CRISPR-associated protein, Cse1 family n=1 Tax=Syntrophobacter fumaroxidans (strain DSM 10017 / MPOB) TaxID=335543 RepID=A0LM51_SYNFM|nr:type I-E CRISPR-associated protein Cse1/CasA [Syntrophobacter fumaroxidans]ABK18503.1 CRISPR-associated protein, Cse1 family [Syntrophobacter fumaroxidans MPOB]